MEPPHPLLLTFTTACAESGHAVCQEPEICERIAAASEKAERNERRASAYDARGVALTRDGAMPDHSWSTSELVLRVEELLNAQPNTDGPFRIIAITTGLARLGERGLSPD